MTEYNYNHDHVLYMATQEGKRFEIPICAIDMNQARKIGEDMAKQRKCILVAYGKIDR